MAKTLTQAKAYIAGCIGAQNDVTALSLAGEALIASLADWTKVPHCWSFLLKDTARGFSVASCSINNSTTVQPPSTGAFDCVNKGVTVTGTAGIPASTTVSDYTRNSSGNITAITLSNATTGGLQTVTLTFSGNIPVISGVQEYNAPPDFNKPYEGGARLLTLKWSLDYKDYSLINLITRDHTLTGPPLFYTIFNPDSAATQGTDRLRLFFIPSTNDTLYLQYYRRFDPTKTFVDIPDDYLYNLLDYAQWRFLQMKDSTNERLPSLRDIAFKGLQAAIDDDENNEDDELRFISQYEIFMSTSPWPIQPI